MRAEILVWTAGGDVFALRSHAYCIAAEEFVGGVHVFRTSGIPRQLAPQRRGVALIYRSATLRKMPTTRPRHFVTETDDLAEALDEAARRWPSLSRPQLLVRLAMEGHHAAQQRRDERRRRRVEAIRTYSGTLTGAYGPDYLKHLHEDWPA